VNDQPGINIVGFVTGNLGLGVIAREVAKAAISVGDEMPIHDRDAGSARSMRDLSLAYQRPE